ncbi:MAG: PA2778 family cysteine peptidase [Gammaproteobacteria bacterium]|nr:PA2778 family cysteine peptidase [Gammaproteobacteria bacterium]
MPRRLTDARLLAGVLPVVLLLSACSQTLTRTTLPAELPQRVELAETPFYPQQRYQCGPAALAMALGQRGVAVGPDELVSRLYLPQRQGSVAPEMIATARGYGMVVYELSPSLDSLLREVAAGNPVVVLQNLGLAWLPKWHYAVVVGYDLERQQLVLRSGTTERHQPSLALFDRTWQRARRWGITLLQPGHLPASDDPLNYLKAAYALEQTQQPAAALAAYRGGSGRWPEVDLLWLAQANLEYGQGNYRGAEQSLRTGLAHHPLAAPLWNNLAYALAQQGCRAEALDAVACAMTLAPELAAPAYAESRGEISMMVGVMSGTPVARCRPISCPTESPAK